MFYKAHRFLGPSAQLLLWWNFVGRAAAKSPQISAVEGPAAVAATPVVDAAAAAAVVVVGWPLGTQRQNANQRVLTVGVAEEGDFHPMENHQTGSPVGETIHPDGVGIFHVGSFLAEY